MTLDDVPVREHVDPPDGFTIAYDVGYGPTGVVVVAYEDGAEYLASESDARERASRHLYEPPPRPFVAVDLNGDVTLRYP